MSDAGTFKSSRLPISAARPCPLCDEPGSGARLLFHSEDGPVVRCRSCGMIYLNTQVRETDLDVSPDYLANFLESHARLLPCKLPAARQNLDALGDGIGSLLEVGLGVGALARACAERGIEYACVEPYQALVDAAVEHGILRPEQAIVSTLEEANLPAAQYDAVAMIMVLEHLLEPRAALAQCLHALRPGGTLYIEIPNSRLFPTRVRLRRLLKMTDFVDGHVNFFTPPAIRRAMHEAGAVEVGTRVISNFRRGEGEQMIDLYSKSAGPLRAINGLFRRFPLDQWLGVACVLACQGRKPRLP